MSDTSSDVKINYQTSNGSNIEDVKKNQTTDTDYYFGMIANPSKIIIPDEITESSEINNYKDSSVSSKSSYSKSSSKSSKSSSKSREKFEHINIPKPSTNNYSNYSNEQQSETRYTDYKKPDNDIPKVKPMTQQEIRLKKIELLRKLSELKTKGYQLSKEYDFNSSIEEMEYEHDLIKSFASKRDGVSGYKQFILQGISIIEYFNDKYDPFNFHLTGWGTHLQVEMNGDTWESTLEELYEKYKGSGKDMPPEARLLLLMGISAGAYHMAKSSGTENTGISGMATKFIGNKKESSQFMTEQEIHIEKLREDFRRKDMEQKQEMEQLRRQIRAQEVNNGPVAANFKPPVPADNFRDNKINNNESVQDILNRYRNVPNLRPNNTDTQDETTSNNDRLISESNISESNPRRKYNKKKSNISVM